jgi:cobalt-zinc-cadmium efflux system protein
MSHSHEIHDHDLPHRHGAQTHLHLFWPVALTLGFAFVEAAGGWLTNSLALMGDAGHMFSDAASLALTWFAAWVALKPPSKRHTYGLARVEVLVALFNGAIMLAVIMGIAYEAILRLSTPHLVQGGAVMVIAFAGLVINLVVAWFLHRAEKNINSRAAMLHVLGDLLGSVAALAAGAVVYFTGWLPIDPLLSLFISVLLLISTINLLREAVQVLMEGVPRHIDTYQVEHAMSVTQGVGSIHDVHIWTLASGVVALSAHVVMQDMHEWMDVLPRMREMLDARFGINHVTLQPETKDFMDTHDHHAH